MGIVERNGLDEAQMNAVREMECICKAQDGLQGSAHLSNAMNIYPDMHCFFLFYEEDQLRGFLSVFAPTPHEGEIFAYTLPAYRRQGIFSALLGKALAELTRYGIREVLFVHEPCSPDAGSVFGKLPISYAFTEYKLCYEQNNGNAVTGDLVLRLAREEDIEEMVTLNMHAFDDDAEAARSIVVKTLASDSMTSYVAILEDKVIGVGNINDSGPEASLFGLCISPEYRGKGYGKAMLRLLIQAAQAFGTQCITLEVNSQNERAYAMYRHAGFTVRAQYDYERMMLE